MEYKMLWRIFLSLNISVFLLSSLFSPILAVLVESGTISDMPLELSEFKDRPFQSPPKNNNFTPPPMDILDMQSYDFKGTMSASLEANGVVMESFDDKVESLNPDVNAILAHNGGQFNIKNDKILKSGDDNNGDNCNFYGINSIVLAANKDSKIYISDSDLIASGEGNNAIFSSDNAVVFLNNNQIKTTKGNSRGLDATYGGKIIANDMEIQTDGDHCATLATDRGGGFISITNSNLNTHGSGSPLIYSTGNIEVNNITGVATGSQIAGLEGSNVIKIFNSKLTSTNENKTASDPIANGVIIYQSTSGDAQTSVAKTALFEAIDSRLTSAIKSGAMFYITNTTANILLSNTELIFDNENVNLFNIVGNDSNNWGKAGKNGGNVVATLKNEKVCGNIEVDTISSLDLYLIEGSQYMGTARIVENDNGDHEKGKIKVNIDKDSKWIINNNVVVDDLNFQRGAQIVDINGKTVNIIFGKETVVKGDSEFNLTVIDNYNEKIDLTEFNDISVPEIDRSEFDDYFSLSTNFFDYSNEKSLSTYDVGSLTGSSVNNINSDDNLNIKKVIISLLIVTVVVVGVSIVVVRRVTRFKS